MSFQRREILSTERYNRILRIANLDPLQYHYDETVEKDWGVYLNDRVKRDFLTQVSMLANERLLTHDIRTREGKVYGQTFTLTVGAPVRIDLLDRRGTTGFVGVIPMITGKPVPYVRLVNKGTGDVYYSLNTQDNGSVLLPNGATVVHDGPIERYEAINLRAEGSTAVVNVAVEI